MLSLIPTLNFARPANATGLFPKLGGLPWGLATSLWPVCKECDMVLHLFKCEGEDVCSFWEADIGTNAAFFLPRSDLGEGYTPVPELTTEVLPELWVTGWEPFEDPVPPEMAEAINDPIRWLNDFTDDMLFPASHRTKLGGAPWWTGNGPQRLPAAPFTYLLQIDQFLQVADADNDVDFGNFCSDGTCYVFIDTESMRATMFINR